MKREQIAKLENKYLLGMFVTCIGADYQTDYEPKIYPNWSEDSKRLWTEIESRMKEPTVLDFDKDGCIEQIRQEIRKQNELASPPDYTTSYHVGIASGLNTAWRIIEDHIRSDG